MKKLVTYVLILSAALFLPPILRSDASYQIIPPQNAQPLAIAPKLTITASSTETSQPSIQEYVQSRAKELGVNPDLANCIVEHESQWQADRIGDIGNPNGESYGLWQIEVAQHLDITQAEALDPFESTDWALSKIAAGQVGMWSTYSQKPYYCRDIPLL